MERAQTSEVETSLEIIVVAIVAGDLSWRMIDLRFRAQINAFIFHIKIYIFIQLVK